ncbi:unnamed protein product [Ostreobium quekettii]|uniref:UBC core domain-containing protein n=1 Tax=Ostreobium quekettii TaxID=121088 RepID=A0A8S1IWM8_9CHLO|nr:unnamed protein product [Ostreobium quekettii]
MSDNLQALRGCFPGPKDTPYEGGLFDVDIQLDNQYPFVPPKMRFLTKVWHPNISSQNGAICLDILKDQWSPALTIKTALLSLQALLSSPQADDPQVSKGQWWPTATLEVGILQYVPHPFRKAAVKQQEWPLAQINVPQPC